MHPIKLSQDTQTSLPAAGLLTRMGRAIQRKPKIVTRIQWSIVALYLFLLLAPLLVPEPAQNTPLFQNIHFIARFAFWGFGWPFIMLSMMLFGRVWCGLFCPDGTITQAISRHGQKRSIPRWIRWGGWPFIMLGTTTIYAQLINAYHVHPGTLLLLGIPTLGAILIGFLYGFGRRIWCMYLCPANGVFSLLAKISPFYFRVDTDKWKTYSGLPRRVECPPLIDIQHMQSTSACHACFKCSGYREAVDFAIRSPASEILNSKNVPNSEAFMLLFGVIGLCTSALLWSRNTWFIHLRSLINQWFSIQDMELTGTIPWWLIANHAEANTGLLNGISLLLFIVVGGLFLGLFILALIWLAGKIMNDVSLPWQKLSLGLIPVAGMGLFLGLTTVTSTLLLSSGLTLSGLPVVRFVLLTLLTMGSLFSIYLGARLILDRITLRRAIAFLIYLLPIVLLHLLWTFPF